MDPTANVIEYLRLIAGRSPEPEDADRALELAEALIEWTGKGGFPPDWHEVARAARGLTR